MMASDLNDKVDLNAEVIRGVKYRVIRDALLRLGENFHQGVLAVFVWQDKIGGAYQRETGSCGLHDCRTCFGSAEGSHSGSCSCRARVHRAICVHPAARRRETLANNRSRIDSQIAKTSKTHSTHQGSSLFARHHQSSRGF
jgi:hypothetical protein